jgi:hypothetical protein
MSCLVGIQDDPHTVVCVFVVGNSAALNALPDSVHGRAKMLGSLFEANTRPGLVSCGILYLSHEGNTRPLGPGTKALRGPSSAVKGVMRGVLGMKDVPRYQEGQNAPSEGKSPHP